MPRWNPLQNAEEYKATALAKRNAGRGSTATVYETAAQRDRVLAPKSEGEKDIAGVVSGWKSDRDLAQEEFRRALFPERYATEEDFWGGKLGIGALLAGGGAAATLVPPDAQASPLAQILTQVAPPPAQQSVTSYTPTLREKLGQLLMGEGVGSQARRDFVSGLIGSTGLGTGTGVIDVTPARIPMMIQESYRQGDPQGMALAVSPVRRLPIGGVR